jgi:hypothetical protein
MELPLQFAKEKVDALRHLEKASYWNRDACENAVDDACDALTSAEERLEENPSDEDLLYLVAGRKEALVAAREALNKALDYQIHLWDEMEKLSSFIQALHNKMA